MTVKQITAADAAAMVKTGMTVMIGGFMSCGTPLGIVDALVAAAPKHLTVVANDCGTPGYGIGKLVDAGLIDAMIATHIGRNPAAGRMMGEGKINIKLVPQGTFAEQIRAGGAGLGGILTPTGIGTEVETGKRIIEVDGRSFILETPLRAEIALVRGSIIDKAGNIFYKGTTKNFNPLMAAAADVVIAEAETIVEIGEIEPEFIMTPGIFVDYVVGGHA